MPRFRVYVSWGMSGSMEIEAANGEEAIDIARETDLPEGEYSDDSFDVGSVYEMDAEGNDIVPGRRRRVTQAFTELKTEDPEESKL